MARILNVAQSGDPRVLVHQLGSLGDTVVSLPSLRALRRHFGPGAHLALLHESRPGVPVVPGSLLSPGAEVNEFIAYPIFSHGLRQLPALAQLWLRIRRGGFSTVVSLAPAERTARQVARDRWFFRFAGIRRQLGFRVFAPGELYPRDPGGGPGRTPHEARFRLRRLEMDGIDVSREGDLDRPFYFPPAGALQQVETWLRARGWKPGNLLVALAPGAKQPTNLWPLERFAEIGKRVRGKGAKEVIVVGGEAERKAGEQLVRQWGGGWNAAGEMDVPASAALLKKVSLLVGLDTGTTHLAAAMGTPCVALYSGRDHPGRWEPLGQGHVVIRSPVGCSPCRIIHAPCPVPGHPCMNQIGVEEVWTRVQEALGRAGVPAD